MQRKLFLALFVAAFVPVLVFASGKIHGKVTDAGTGEPLVGANVVVAGTQMGAATNVSGEFVILNVPAGTYTLRSTYVGYQAITITNLRVNDELTTEANFPLPAEGVTVGTVEIVAQRPLVNKSATNAVRIIDNSFFETLPGRGVNLAVSVQPGVVVQNNNVYIRGSRPDEVGYYVNGVNVSNKVNGGNGLFVPAEAVEQIQVQAGGYNAEYGSANAGIVSTQLRSGSAERWRASVLAETDRYAKYGTESLNGYTYGYSDYTATVGGPIISNKLRFFGSAENTFYRDQSTQLRTPYSFTNLVTDPIRTPAHHSTVANDPNGPRSDTIPSYVVGGNFYNNPSNRWAFAGTVSYDMDKLQVRAGGSYSTLTSRTGTAFANYLNQDRVILNDTRDGFANLKVSYLFTPTTYLEANGGWYFRSTNNRDPYWDWNLFAYGDSALNAAHGWYLLSQGQPYDPYSFYNGAITGLQQPGQPQVDAPYKDRMDTYSGKVDFTSQLDKHLLKVGGEYSRGLYRRYNPRSVISWAQLQQQAHNARELETNLNLTVSGGADLLGYDVYGNKVNGDVAINDASGNPGMYYFAPPKPTFAAAYVQDKIELSDIILNVGLRWDYIDPDSRTTTDPGNLTYNADKLLAPSVFQKTATTSVVSPRIGFSFPVSDRTVFHAQFGRFIQSAQLNDSYAGPARIAGVTKTGNWLTAVTGWGLLPEKDTQYELGFAEAISDNASFDVTAFYKDIRDQIQFVIIAPTPGAPSTQQYHSMQNADFSTSKGIEFTFTLRRTQRVAAQINYTFSDARSTATNETGSNGIWQLGLGPNSLPKYVFPVDFNQTHRGTILLDYRFAKDDGGPILSQLGANLMLQFNSGHAYTRVDAAGRGTTGDTRNRTPLEPIGASTTPWFFQLDMRLDKTVNIAEQFDLDFYIYVINLLGTDNPINAFIRTGDPNNDGYLATTSGISDTQSLGQGFVNLYSALNNGANSGNYGPPRQIRFGLKFDY